MKIKTQFGLVAGCVILLGATYAVAQGNTSNHAGNGQAAHESAAPNLVKLVRNATKQFIVVNAATAAGYAPFLGCVTGPQALIYEPSDGAMQLVGVEYVVFANAWLASHNNIPPVLDGQVLQFIDSPNRYNLPALFELHVWPGGTIPRVRTSTGTIR